MKTSEFQSLDEMKSSWADVLHSWEHLEQTMMMVFHTVLTARRISVSEIVFNTIASPRMLRTLIDNLAFELVPEPQLRELNKLTERFSRMASKRNGLVHGRWCQVHHEQEFGAYAIEWYRKHLSPNLDAHYPPTTFESDQLKRRERWYSKDLKEQKVQFSSLALDIQDFIPKLAMQISEYGRA